MRNNIIPSMQSYIKNKLRRLRKDKLYDYSVFGPINNEKKAVLRTAISRLAKEGVIVKVGNGKFYKKDIAYISQEKSCILNLAKKGGLNQEMYR